MMKLDVLLPNESFEVSASQMTAEDLKRNMLAAAKLLRLITANNDNYQARWLDNICLDDYSEPVALWSDYKGALCYYGCLMGRKYAELTGNHRPARYFQDLMPTVLSQTCGQIGLPNWRTWSSRLRASQTALYFAADYRAFKRACVRAHKMLLAANQRMHRRGMPVDHVSFKVFTRLQHWDFVEEDFPSYSNTVWHALESNYNVVHPANPYRSLGYCRTGRSLIPHVGRFYRE